MPDPVLPVPPLPQPGQQRAWWSAPASPSALALHIGRAAAAHAGPLLVVARDNHGAQQLESDLRTLLARDHQATWPPLLHFPDWETLPYDQFSPHPDIVSQRLAALHRMPTLERGIVVVPVQTLLQRLAPVQHIAGGSFDLAVGARLDLDDEKRRLEAAGYRNVPQVLDPGDFAVRGGLLDVYPMGAEQPFRVELLDEEIDTIRVFDPESQRSLEKIERVHLLPGRELPLDEAALQRALDALRERFDIDTRRSALYQDLKAGAAPAGIEYYLPLFFKQTSTLFDYLGANALPVLCEGALEAAEQFWANTRERYEQRRHDVERPLLPPDALYLSPEQLRERLNQGARVEVCGPQHAQRERAADLGDQPAPTLPLTVRDHAPADALKSFLGSYPGRVLIAADSAGRREALLEILRAAALEPEVLPDWAAFLPQAEEVTLPKFALAVAPLEDGFALTAPALAVLTERQLFPERAAQPRRRKRAGRDPEAIIRDLGELSEGA
ncbi:MAG TPA: transcription-repair coupling factor, partial [Xanthomonadaceae bacterium]|nr:transcription-repair coupling factor [Xanthomonadaceae bacterium]